MLPWTASPACMSKVSTSSVQEGDCKTEQGNRGPGREEDGANQGRDLRKVLKAAEPGSTGPNKSSRIVL